MKKCIKLVIVITILLTSISIVWGQVKKPSVDVENIREICLKQIENASMKAAIAKDDVSFATLSELAWRLDSPLSTRSLTGKEIIQIKGEEEKKDTGLEVIKGSLIIVRIKWPRFSDHIEDERKIKTAPSIIVVTLASNNLGEFNRQLQGKVILPNEKTPCTKTLRYESTSSGKLFVYPSFKAYKMRTNPSVTIDITVLSPPE